MSNLAPSSSSSLLITSTTSVPNHKKNNKKKLYKRCLIKTKVSEAVTNHNFQFNPQFIASRKAGPAPAHPGKPTSRTRRPSSSKICSTTPNTSTSQTYTWTRSADATTRPGSNVNLLGSMIAGAQAAAPGLPSAPKAAPAFFVRLYILCESGAATLMSIAMMVNQILRIFNPHDLLLE